jgi:hypothetical protein
MFAFVRRLLPLLVAVFALLIAVRGTDLTKLRFAMEHVPMAALIGASAVMAVLNCAADTLAMFYVFRWFGLHLRFFDLYTIRAATYTLAVINYHAGQLGIIGYLHRVGRVSLPRASAYILFIVGVWVALLLLFAGGSLMLGGAKAQAMAPVLGVFLLGLFVYALLLRWPPRFLREGPPAQAAALTAAAPFMVRLWRRVWYRLWRIIGKLWAPLMEAGVLGHGRAMLVRLPHLGVLLVWHFIALRCFEVQVPVHVAVLYLPVVFAVASLPISVQGLGTSQVAAKYFFTEFAAAGEESVLAYSLSMTAISTASNLIMGFLFLRRGARLGLADMAESAARGLDSAAEVAPVSPLAAADDDPGPQAETGAESVPASSRS